MHTPKVSGYAAFTSTHHLSETTSYASAVALCRELGVTSSRLWDSWVFTEGNMITTQSLYDSLRQRGAVL